MFGLSHIEMPRFQSQHRVYISLFLQVSKLGNNCYFYFISFFYIDIYIYIYISTTSKI